MNIISLEIKGLFGYIDKIINFNEDINLLVGINGSGKTSVLNIISWLIKPSLAHLCVTEFRTVKLKFRFKEKIYQITVRHNKKNLTYRLETENEKFHHLLVRTSHDFNQVNNSEELKSQLLSNYSRLAPTSKEEKTWQFLTSILPDPIIIGLDRNLYVDDDDNFYIEKNNQNRGEGVSVKSGSSPLDRVKTIVNTEYRKKKNTILKLTNGLKNHLMLSAFKGSITLNSINTGIRYKLQTAQIEQAETRITSYISQYESKTFTEIEKSTIANYFTQLKEVTKQYQDNPNDSDIKILYGLNSLQFSKINSLLKEFEKFEKNSSETLAQIHTYLDTINFFLKDSSKELLFKEDTSELRFNTIDKNGQTLTKFRDVKFLSSGEQQILILFSYLAFNSQDGKLFIIDEPELSLHVKWQEDFLSHLEKLMPKTTQVLLATHSPILVGKKKEKAILLLPYNN